MTGIVSIWEDYFHDPHEGLGTTYERFILHRYFEKIKDRFSVENILEFPSFGMTGVSGINSMWWSAKGVDVTVMDTDNRRLKLIDEVWKGIPLEATLIFNRSYKSLPFDNDCFDVSWNFASLWFVSDLRRFLREFTRITRKAIFFCVPNRFGLGYLARFAFQKNKPNGMDLENIKPDKIIHTMSQLGWILTDDGYFDVPPWPDIAMKKEDLMKMIGIQQLFRKEQEKNENCLCILDYFRGAKPYMGKEIMKYSFLENSPVWFKLFWAHHRYFIFVPEGE